MSFILVYITHPDEVTAREVSEQLLRAKMVACANIFPISSAYWWEAEICHEEEYVSLVKTLPDKWEALKEKVIKIHPYDVPCLMRVEVSANSEYEEWIRREVTA